MVGYLHFFGSGYFDNRYISANAPETDQVKRTFATSQVNCIRWDCVYTSYRTFSGMMLRALGWASGACLGAFGFYLNVTKQAGFRSRKLWNRQAC